MLLNHAWQCLMQKHCCGTKNLGFFFFFNGRRALCPAFLKNGRRALNLGIFQKPQAF